MKRKWTVLFCLLIIVVLSGCAAGVYPKGATEDYKLGYNEGMNAGYASGQGILAGQLAGLIGMRFGGSAFAPSELSDKVQKEIQGESVEYQRGFTEGWGQGVRFSANSNSMIFDMIYSEDD